MLVGAIYKAGTCKKTVALLGYWLQQQTGWQQCASKLAMQVQCAAITSPSDLQHIHIFKGGTDSVYECFTVAV